MARGKLKPEKLNVGSLEGYVIGGSCRATCSPNWENALGIRDGMATGPKSEEFSRKVPPGPVVRSSSDPLRGSLSLEAPNEARDSFHGHLGAGESNRGFSRRRHGRPFGINRATGGQRHESTIGEINRPWCWRGGSSGRHEFLQNQSEGNYAGQLLIFVLLALAVFGDRVAHAARVLAVEGHGHSFGKPRLSRVIHQHPAPRHHLQHRVHPHAQVQAA